MCKTLSAFDDDNLIPAYGFGDSKTTDKFVFSLKNNADEPCHGLEGVLEAYNTIVTKFQKGYLVMSGPTSFVPIINQAIEIVKNTRQYHILLIICDGAVTDESGTIDAIVKASKYPLSIVCIGVGKGPWDVMEKFDDKIPQRDFDNFQFVPFYDIMKRCENDEIEFSKNALMEIPEQYDYIRKHIMN
jgi:hypothetical protein